MEVRRPNKTVAAVAAAWLAMAVSIGIDLVVDYKLGRAGRADLQQFPEDGLLFALPILSCAVVGSALAVRRPHHAVGWLFLALAVVINLSGTLDAYTAYGAVARPGSLPASGLVATVADASFIAWLSLLSGVLLLTPSGQLQSGWSRIAAAAVAGGAAVSFALALVRPYRGDYAALGTIENPLAVESLAEPFGGIALAALIVLHIGLLMGVGLLLMQFRGARGRERRQLRWMALAAIPFPVLVVGAFVAATLNNETALGLTASGFVAVLPIAAGLAIERDHLYDVDRLLSRGLTYSLLSVGVIACYALVVLFVGQALGDFGGDSNIPAIAATLVTVSVALPARRHLQDGLDRRFNRRRFEAIAAIRRFVGEPSPETSVEQALQRALGDNRLTLAYWIDERERWVDEQGELVTPAPGARPVTRRGSTIASVEFDRDRTDEGVLDAAVAAALPEIENARLRAAIALQLVEVRDSRARIVAAQREERRKIERNLHDGAQQRLLALALRMRAAEVSAEPERLRAALHHGVDELQRAVQELRELASGLHPSILNDGGLSAALDELAARTPVRVQVESTDDRFPPAVEEAAWFIACEGVANAVKHARPSVVSITCARNAGHLRITIADDGTGGADAGGSGLRGIADRAEAIGGRITVDGRPQGGTLLQAELPCGS